MKLGNHTFIHNNNLRWLCMRDIPPGHFPGCPPMHRREVNYVTSTHATLRNGTPMLHFQTPSRDCWDFRFMPFGKKAVPCLHGLRRITARGDILNADQYPREFQTLNQLSQAMTHLAFCGMQSDGQPLRHPWFRRRPTHMEPFVVEPPNSKKHLVRHQFTNCIDRKPVSIDLPHDARIYTFEALSKEGTGHIPPTTCFGRALGNLPPESWQRRSLANRWNSLSEVCDKQRIGLLQRIWFQQQGLRHPIDPTQILFPAALAAAACHDIPPLGTWWDFTPAAAHFDNDTATYILPPIPRPPANPTARQHPSQRGNRRSKVRFSIFSAVPSHRIPIERGLSSKSQR